MISPITGSLMLIERDGSRKPLEIDHVQNEIEQACLVAGCFQESWIAEDIVSGVEFALSQLPSSRRDFLTDIELHCLVSKLMQQAGLEVASRIYLEFQSMSEESLLDHRSQLVRFLSENFADSDYPVLGVLAERIETAVQQLKITNPSSDLVLALAKQWIGEMHVKSVAIPVPILNMEHTQYQWDIQDLLNEMDSKISVFYKKGIILVQEISPIFPILRIGIDFVKYIDFKNLESPITELCLYPLLDELSSLINQIIEMIKSKLDEKKLLSMELYSVNSSIFVQQNLQVLWPDPGEKMCLDLLTELSSQLKVHPYKINAN